MFLSNLGDSFCIVFYKNGASSLLSIDKNKPYEDKINRAIKQIAQEANTTVREIIGSSRVNKLFKDRAIYTHNQTDGSGQGILNGDYRAQQYIQNEYIATDKIESVLIATDGLLPPGIKKDKIKDRQKIAKWLKSGGLERVIAIKKCTEDADPDWNYVRTKHSDDATGVYLEFLVQ